MGLNVWVVRYVARDTVLLINEKGILFCFNVVFFWKRCGFIRVCGFKVVCWNRQRKDVFELNCALCLLNGESLFFFS